MKYRLIWKLTQEKTLYGRGQNSPEAMRKKEKPRVESGGFFNYSLLRPQSFPPGILGRHQVC